MIKRTHNLDARMDVVLYGRMSSDDQNPRSPDQQFDAILHEMKQRGKPWNVVAKYRDDGISGRKIKGRSGLMSMIRDIKTGKLKAQAILVHTYERFGRNDDMTPIRLDLDRNHGVLLLTCDSGFADPTTSAGQALGFMEQMRSTSVNPVKAAEVLRGKKDLAVQKRWPGGPPPFGFRLKHHLIEQNGRSFATLEPDPATAGIIQAIFQQAHTMGWGTTRLARWLNKDDQIPAQHKPFYNSTIGYWLDQPIYYGELLWAKYATDVINDVRVLQRNEASEQVRVPDFCPPLISRELWDAVQAIRNLRRTKKSGAEGDDQPRRPLGAGRVLKWMLSGLVRCGECNASMQPMSSGGASKKGTRYPYYRCPRFHGRACLNATTVREDALRQAVLSTLRHTLFPIDPEQSTPPPWLAGLFKQVRAELQKLSEQAPDRGDALRQQIDQVDSRLSGWVQSLGKPDLSAALRGSLEEQYAAASAQKSALDQELRGLDYSRQATEELLDEAAVLRRVQRLEQVLAGSNPTLANVELSRHIDRIDVHADSRVVLRACRLGVLTGAAQFLARAVTAETSPIVAPAFEKVRARARPKLRVDDEDLEIPGNDLMSYADMGRFEGLEGSWFWEEVLEIPKTSCWSKTHAAEVAELRTADPKHWTLPRLAERFGVSVPTARKALRAGQKAAGITIEPRRLAPRGVPDYHAIVDEAARLYLREDPPWTIRKIARHFKVNQITVSKALDHWYAQHGAKRPDGRNPSKGRVDPTAASPQKSPASAA